jgi:hypothetical protein
MTTLLLECAECGRVSDEAADGWQAPLTLEEDGSELVAVFWLDCAQEFAES